ncbi:Hypothetical predicted protein [Pelobates cultripes]|uniref:Uncharacterized protein n=1 Tax=Pelobates cultripes TaxID=61616 RepID=A0AAD1R5J3_PELCU|nr:Hypothetical predicted protein [Pelobates cultripes]
MLSFAYLLNSLPKKKWANSSAPAAGSGASTIPVMRLKQSSGYIVGDQDLRPQPGAAADSGKDTYTLTDTNRDLRPRRTNMGHPDTPSRNTEVAQHLENRDT